MSAQFIILSPSENSGRKSERRAELKGRKPAPSPTDPSFLPGLMSPVWKVRRFFL